MLVAGITAEPAGKLHWPEEDLVYKGQSLEQSTRVAGEVTHALLRKPIVARCDKSIFENAA